MSDEHKTITRREMLRTGICGTGLLGLGGLAWLGPRRSKLQHTVWQIDPTVCEACGNCATYCVLEESAVKCMHNFDSCGYCRICFGYFEPQRTGDHEGAENQLCPTGAIVRRLVRDPNYQDIKKYEYTIDEKLCVGCGVCVKGCENDGNGSLYLQIRHDRCLNCNQCSIAAACPTQAIRRVPADQPYIQKEAGHEV